MTIRKRLILFSVLAALAACTHGGSPDIRVMGDHSDALFFWAEHKAKARTVVHIDAHSDFRPISPSDIDQIRTLLSMGTLQSRTNTGPDSLLHIGNFVFAAAKLGMVKDVCWIVTPRPIVNDTAAEPFKKQLIRDRHMPEEVDSAFRLESGCMAGSLQGIPITVCGSASLPKLEEPVLLDIDIDYFVKLIELFPAMTLFDHVERLRSNLAASGIRSDMVTIAKSLKGKFTPIEYVYLAAAMREMAKDPSRPLTGPFWEIFRLRSDADARMREGNLPAARKALDAILEELPGDSQAHYLLAKIATEQGETSPFLAFSDFIRRLFLHQP
jgi:hypothetical protein